MFWLEEYEINPSTCILIPIDKYHTKVIELENELIIPSSTLEILYYSCRYYGSSYLGRKAGSINILKNIYKIPIIVEESRNIIFFPLSSPRYHHATWISLGQIKSYRKKENITEVIFQNNQKMTIEISYQAFQNQVLRASYLEIVSNNRKNKE